MTREEARNLVRRLRPLSGGPEVLRKAAARELERYDALEVNELLDHLLALSRDAWEPATFVLPAFLAALRHETFHRVADMRRVAQVQALESVVDLFTEGAARKELAGHAASKADAKLFAQPLGYLTQSARLTRDPDMLARLVTHSDRAVVRNALINSRMTEALVVRMAARRPARPEPLMEIAASPRWAARHAVRRALVFNPYLPPEVGAKIVPLLNVNDLEELAGDPGVHASLREQAERLLLEARVREGRV